MNNAFKLGNTVKVTYYPYRSARVFGEFFRLDRHSEEAKEFEKQLNKKAGQNYIDNHTVYTIVNTDGSTIHVGSILKLGMW